MDTRAHPVDDVLSATGALDALDAEPTPLDRATDVALSLATAWTTFGLYPDPTAQPAFLRTVQLLEGDLAEAIILGVGPGTLTFDEIEVAHGRESVERLAKALFLHDIEYAVVTGNATASGIVELFRLLAVEPDPVSPHAAAEAAIELDGAGVELYVRGQLDRGSGKVQGKDQDDESALVSNIAQAAFTGATPEELAGAVMDTEGDPGDMFMAGFTEVHETIAPKKRSLSLSQMKGRGDDPWKGLRNLIEAFFFLPRPVQLTVLETVLAHPDVEEHRVFLDQLSGLDLAEFLPDLSDQAREALLEYAVASAGTTDGQPTEVLETLQAATDVQDARMAMAERVSSLLNHPEHEMGQPIEEMLEKLRAELSAIPGPDELGRQVLRSLLECEVRPDRFRRIVRMWTGRVARTIRSGEFEEADRLLNGVLEDPPYDVEREPVVNEGLARMTSPDLLRSFVELRSDEGFDEPALRLLRRLAPRVFDQMIERLAETDDAQERRMITELLAASLTDVRRVEVHLNDPRWFVIRNLAIVLGKSGKQAAVLPLERILGHEEHRVRVEALRSLVRLSKGDSAELLIRGLRDEHERVRHTALALLKSSESESLEDHVDTYLADDSVDPEIGKALLIMLLERRTPQAIEIVQRLAGRKFAARGNVRALRDSAKTLLKRARL